MNKLVAVILYLTMTTLLAAEVGDLTTFSAGTPAKAAEVNKNFNDVKSAVNENYQRLLIEESKSTQATTQINDLQTSSDANATAITTLQSNMNGKQTVLSNSCAVGSAIRAIEPNGAVTCEALEKSGKLSLQPTEFHPTSENFAVVGNCQALMGDSAFFGSGTLSSCAMLAAAHFPQGATISSFQCFVLDTNSGVPAASIYANLYRFSLTQATNDAVAISTTQSGSTNSYETISTTSALINNVVDNNNYYYRVNVTFNAGASTLSAIGFGQLTLRNCTADYTMP